MSPVLAILRVVAFVTVVLAIAPAVSAQVTCSLVRNTVLPDTCAGLCLPGQTCVATATRPYGFGLFGTQAAACGCTGAGLAPTPIPAPTPVPVPAPPTTLPSFAVGLLLAIAIAVAVALAALVAVALFILAGRIIRWAGRKFLERVFCYPRLVGFTAQRTQVVVYSDGGRCALSFGRFPATRGIRFEATVIVPPGPRGRPCRGRLEFVQDVVTLRTRTPGQNPANPKECLDSNGSRVLDTTDPYMSFTLGPGRHTVATDDSPETLLRPFEIKTADDQFRMFLMWRPMRFGGRLRLPIARIDWWWKGEARVTAPAGADCVEGANGWSLVSRPTDHGHFPATRTIGYPTTSPNVTSLTWQRC